MSEKRSDYKAMWERLKDDLRHLEQKEVESDIPIVLIWMQNIEEVEQLRSKIEQSSPLGKPSFPPPAPDVMVKDVGASPKIEKLKTPSIEAGLIEGMESSLQQLEFEYHTRGLNYWSELRVLLNECQKLQIQADAEFWRKQGQSDSSAR